MSLGSDVCHGKTSQRTVVALPGKFPADAVVGLPVGQDDCAGVHDPSAARTANLPHTHAKLRSCTLSPHLLPDRGILQGRRRPTPFGPTPPAVVGTMSTLGGLLDAYADSDGDSAASHASGVCTLQCRAHQHLTLVQGAES